MSERTFYSEEAKNRVRRETTLTLAVVLALGISIGTALAMLFAPKSGDETRDEIGDATNSAYKRLESQFNTLKEKVEERIAS